MRQSIQLALVIVWFTAAAGVLVISPRSAMAQTCDDENAMVQSSRQDLSDLLGTIKKESLQDFENKFHQKSSLSKLTFASGLVGELVDCLTKAAQDPAATPDQKTSTNAKHDAAAKLKDKIDHGRDELKSATDAKSAKAILEKLDLAD